MDAPGVEHAKAGADRQPGPVAGGAAVGHVVAEASADGVGPAAGFGLGVGGGADFQPGARRERAGGGDGGGGFGLPGFGLVGNGAADEEQGEERTKDQTHDGRDAKARGMDGVFHRGKKRGPRFISGERDGDNPFLARFRAVLPAPARFPLPLLSRRDN